MSTTVFQKVEHEEKIMKAFHANQSNKREGIQGTVTDCIEHQQDIISAYKAGDFAEAQRVAHDFLVRMKEYLRTALPAATEL